MNRRQILATGASALVLPPFAARAGAGLRTRWSVRLSEGFDAICFLNPLSGDPFYADYYSTELAAFKPKLKPATPDAIGKWFARAKSKGMLLGPALCTLMSGAPDATVADLLAALDEPETRLRPSLEKSPYWDVEDGRCSSPCART